MRKKNIFFGICVLNIAKKKYYMQGIVCNVYNLFSLFISLWTSVYLSVFLLEYDDLNKKIDAVNGYYGFFLN